MTKRKNIPYTYPHKSRKARVEYICGIGGYSRHLDGSWPIEFNVGAWATDFSFDHIWEKYADEHVPEEVKKNPPNYAAYYELAKRLHKEYEDSMWSWGQEDAYRSLNDGDCYRMLWDGTLLDVKLELHGRGGKHLVIATFEGTDFSGCTTEDLEDGLSKGEDGWGWSNEQVALLYKYVRQCEVDFTPEKASAEIEYQGAFCFFANIVASEWETYLKTKADHEAVVGCAQVLYGYLIGPTRTEGVAVMCMFKTLCEAAGVTKEEMEGS